MVAGTSCEFACDTKEEILRRAWIVLKKSMKSADCCDDLQTLSLKISFKESDGKPDWLGIPKQAYHLLGNNCEHLARFIATGKLYSDQVASYVKKISGVILQAARQVLSYVYVIIIIVI